METRIDNDIASRIEQKSLLNKVTYSELRNQIQYVVEQVEMRRVVYSKSNLQKI